MEMQLPAGAVVSRATLWVNGHPQEAAFNSTSQVENAYSWIAERHRDPLLITQTGQDRVLIKASPVVPGHEMKLRIGMTVPLKLNDVGEASVNMPHVIGSNFAFDCKQDVHLTSTLPLYANRVDMHGAQGKNFLLRGNINAGELSKLTIAVPEQSNVTQFATRATHSSPPAFIVATINSQPGPGHGTVTFTKSFAKPDCPIIYSTDAAYRLSYLWAHQEIEQLAKTDVQQAVELASVYREVSSVSGAVVMELESDYTANGLNRSMGLATSYGGGASRRAQAAPKASPMPQPSQRASMMDLSRMDKSAVAHTGDEFAVAQSASADSVAGPMLQGATNGTIGQQGADATVVTGINTAGTVRINNLSNLEAVLNIVAIGSEILLLICGVVLAISGFAARSGPRPTRVVRRFLLGAGLLTLGLAVPSVINFIVACVRDYALIG